MTRDPDRDAEIQARLEAIERSIERLTGAVGELFERTEGSFREKFRPKLFHLYQYAPRELMFQKAPPPVALPPSPPTIAIVTPSLNQGAMIGATIESVVSQGYPALAYRVQDGGSTDQTLAVLEASGAAISWASERDRGQADAINRGFQRVSGEIMGYLNSDDLLTPGSLAYVARYFSEHPKVDFVYGNRIVIDEQGREVGRWVLPPHDARVIFKADFIPQETMFWRRRVWDALGGFDTDFAFAMDWDFILRAHVAGFRFARLPRFLGCFRVHENQKTSALRETGEAESARLKMRYLGSGADAPEMRHGLRRYLRRHVLFHRLYKFGILRM